MTSKIWLVLLALSLSAPAGAEDPPTSSLFIVHFETGPAWDKALAPQDQPSFREHSAHLKRLREEGVIVFGARYADIGMVILSVDTLDKAKSLMESDPGIRSGIFSYRVAPLRVFYQWEAL